MVSSADLFALYANWLVFAQVIPLSLKLGLQTALNAPLLKNFFFFFGLHMMSLRAEIQNLCDHLRHTAPAVNAEAPPTCCSHLLLVRGCQRYKTACFRRWTVR